MGVTASNRMIWPPDVPIIYMDNPKAGSTTIKFTLKQAQAAAYARLGKSFRRDDEPHRADDCLKSRGLRKSICHNRLLISCVRNPFTRALSAYLDKVGTRDPGFFPELRSGPVESFEQFLGALAEFKPGRLNYHFRPQHMNLDFPNISYSAIFYLENSAALSRFLCAVSPNLTLEKNAPHSRSARAKLNDHYTAPAIRFVQEIYAQDFSLFGYSPDLGDVDVVPGECIAGGRIVPVGEIANCAAWSSTVDACPAFDAALRFHRVVETLRLG
jgi:hypothetical protein